MSEGKGFEHVGKESGVDSRQKIMQRPIFRIAVNQWAWSDDRMIVLAGNNGELMMQYRSKKWI